MSETFNGAEQSEETNYNSTWIGLQPMYQAAMDLMMTDPASGMMAMQIYDATVNQAKKDYFVNVAAADVTRINQSWQGYVNYVIAERTADTTRDQAIINATFQRADQMLDNTHEAVSGEIDAAGKLASAVIDIASQYAIDAMSKYLKMVGDIGTATKNIEITEHGAAETFRTSLNAAEQQYDYEYAAALETFTNQEAGAAQTLWQAYATEDESWNNSMADAERDWIQSESTAGTQFVQNVTTERQTLASNELGEYVSYVGNVAGEVVNWATNVGSAFVGFVTTGSTDPALATVAGAWQQFWNESTSADQTFASAAAAAFQNYGNQTAAAEKNAEDNIAAADKLRRDNIADDTVHYVTAVAAAQRGYEFAMSGAMVTEAAQEATADCAFIEGDADAVETRENALAAAEHAHADAATNAAYQLLTSALPAAQAKFNNETNAKAAADKTTASAEIALLHSEADAKYQHDKADLLSAKVTALGLASADDPLYITFAKLMKSNEVFAAVMNVVTLEGQALDVFANLFVGGGGFWASTVNPPPLTVTAPPVSNTSSGDWIDRADQFCAGWADTLTFGGTTRIREWMWGETATRNHQGGVFIAGQIVGFASGAVFGWGGGAGACVKASQLAKSTMSAYTLTMTTVGVANSSYNVATGRASWSFELHLLRRRHAGRDPRSGEHRAGGSRGPRVGERHGTASRMACDGGGYCLSRMVGERNLRRAAAACSAEGEVGPCSRL